MWDLAVQKAETMCPHLLLGADASAPVDAAIKVGRAMMMEKILIPLVAQPSPFAMAGAVPPPPPPASLIGRSRRSASPPRGSSILALGKPPAPSESRQPSPRSSPVGVKRGRSLSTTSTRAH